MSKHRNRFIACLSLVLIFCTSNLAFSAGIPGLSSSGEASTKVKLNEMSKEELDAHLATLSDEESRKLLVEQLETQRQQKKAAEAKVMMGGSYITNAIETLQNRSAQFDVELQKIKEARKNYGEHYSQAVSAIFLSDGNNKALSILFKLALLIAGGMIAATLLFRSIRPTRELLRRDGDYPVYYRLGRSVAGVTLDLLQSGLFVLLTVPLTLVLFEKQSAAHLLASSVLLFIATIWAIRQVFKELLFSPVSKTLFIKGDRCRKIYYWAMMGFFTPVFWSMYISVVASKVEFPTELLRFNILMTTTIAIISLIVGTYLLAQEKRQHTDRESDVLRTILCNNKYWLVVLGLIAFYLIAIKNIVIGANLVEGQRMSPGYLYYAVLMFIFTPMYIRIVRHLIIVQPVKLPLSTTQEATGQSGEEEPDAQPLFSKWARRLFDYPYVILIILFTLEGANIGLLSWFADGSGADFGESAMGIIIACMLGVVAWNVVNSYINKRLPAAVLDPTVLMGSEGGGDEAATRTQTILPIVRSFVLVIIVVVVLFSVLSSLGVNTAPLLAGAGVIGIAIGFGAQKLVQDVVSGMFFLFEDAFRIGEYIDTGSLVGTVESTSVRSLRLRHHLGAVQTIPYGEIRSVKNLSRDFVIMKLSFRVPFDTDIEVVRKTIKKVGQELLKHPELGPDFIAPLKSQGVQTAEDDALVIRMKFTSKPGGQWMIKREAYRRVQEALAAKGINFASRQVTVHVPEAEKADPDAVMEAAGAAAAAAVEDAEKKKLQKPVDPLADM